MARVIGSVATSHVPSIGGAIAKGLQRDPYWKPFFDAFPPTRAWLEKVRPDVAVVVSNDHGLNFFLDTMPTFAIGAAPEYTSADEGWGIPTIPAAKGHPDLSWAIIDRVVPAGFDVTTCQEMMIDHGITVPLQLLWPTPGAAVPIVPVMINTVQHPLPSADRCLAFGRAIGRAIEAYDADLRVLVLATGGLSHQLDGERAGFINPEFDLLCMSSLIDAPERLTGYSTRELVGISGTQGVEILNWIVGRGIVNRPVVERHRTYHIPISNTAAAVQVLEVIGGVERGSKAAA